MKSVGEELKKIVDSLWPFDFEWQMAWFIKRFEEYKSVYKQSVLLSAHKSIADKDLKRAMVAIDNGIKDSFHFMTSREIASTTGCDALRVMTNEKIASTTRVVWKDSSQSLKANTITTGGAKRRT